MYENVSRLGMFVQGPSRHIKVRQLNKLIQEYGVDLLARCEMRTNWRFIADKEDKFYNLFESKQPTRGSSASNTNDGKIKQDQWGGTCIITMGQFSSLTIPGQDHTQKESALSAVPDCNAVSHPLLAEYKDSSFG
jgi:hypothetical protein